MESVLEKHMYSRGLGRSTNMRPSYPHETHYAGKLSLGTPIVRSRLLSRQLCNLFQGTSHPNIRRYRMSVVGLLCLDHNSGLSGGSGYSIQSIHLPLYFYLVY